MRQETDDWVAQGNRSPQLTAILVGQDPASTTYVKNKMKAAKLVGKYCSLFNSVKNLISLQFGLMQNHVLVFRNNHLLEFLEPNKYHINYGEGWLSGKEDFIILTSPKK